MGGIINKQKLAEIREEIEALRSASRSIRSNDLVSLAKKLGRERVVRGKHPQYSSTLLPNRNPISIPAHPGTLKVGTALKILDELEVDADGLSALLEEQERKNDRKRLPPPTIRQSSDSR